MLIMKYIKFVLSTIFLVLVSSCGLFRTPINLENTKIVTLDTVIKIEPYKKIITKEAVSEAGLLYVHKVKNKYYFELPPSIFNREILVVSRFIKTPVLGGYYGGEEIGKKTIVFQKAPNGKILLRVMTAITKVDEGDAIAKAVENANSYPILEAFEVSATNEDTGAYVIDVTDFINSDNYLLTLSKLQKDKYGLTTLEKDKSFITEINTYPINTEIKTVKTYKAKVSSADIYKELPAAVLSGSVTLEINNSFVMLPKDQMRERHFDPRVGYFASSYLKFSDDQQEVEPKAFVHRWRLEPKEEDVEKWKNGELVEPKKQIVYYIDPATPKKWVPYLIKGINDWQPAFEQAGFKNAIEGREWPKDSTMSLEDARFSVIRYFASPMKNAYGPNIVDPRSGEILESHVGWYHNLMSLLHSWYFIQTATVDPRARQMEYDTELMGNLVRFVSSHELGHTLGLRHNMGASYATPVEKLRDNDWLTKHGHTSSIMDYARFNYVAQPEDSISVQNLMPRIGDYDKWAIQWGYTKFPKVMSQKEEKEVLNELVVDSISANPRLWFGGEGRDSDPRSQTEDLGDNAMLASAYGIKNLKRIVPNLKEWIKTEDSDDYKKLEALYTDLVKQYEKYANHVKGNIGGIYVTPKTMGETGEVYGMVSKETQREALQFIDDNVFKEPVWLLDTEILNNIRTPQFKDYVVKNMESIMSSIMGGGVVSRMGFIADRFTPKTDSLETDKTAKVSPKSKTNTTDQETEVIEVYKPEEYLDDLYQMIWGDLGRGFQPTIYERHVQKSYLTNLIALYKPQKAKKGVIGLLAILSNSLTINTDTRALGLSYLNSFHKDLTRTIPRVSDRMTKAHLEYMKKQIEDVFQEEMALE